MVGGKTDPDSGSATVVETKCLGAAIVAGCLDSIGLIVAAPGPLSASVAFPPVHVLAILKDVNVAGGEGTATISNVINTVDQVETPAPATLALLASGLVALGWFGRRRGRRA